jgi:cellulose synthase/poly-beta-1,6-N-acetylglucosamine synthase-like glycosyltransferase
MHEITIIIPSIRWDSLTQQCVSTCLSLFPQSKVILLLDDAHGASESSANLQVILQSGTIAAKRNAGVEMATTEFIAFIDSDAYPEKDWLPKALAALRERPDAAVVGGPNISPPGQEESRRLVGLATKSWLVAGRWNFYKSERSAARYCDNLPACNMVLRRADILETGGMDPALELGEDTDLCARFIASDRTVYFEPKAIVYHYDRRIGDYLRQRIVRGAGLYMLISGGSAQRRSPYTYLMLQPVLTLILVATFPLALAFSPWGIVFSAFTLIYLSLILMEAIRWFDRPSTLPKVALLILTGNLLPGAGFILKAIGLMPPLQRIYRNDNG